MVLNLNRCESWRSFWSDDSSRDCFKTPHISFPLPLHRCVFPKACSTAEMPPLTGIELLQPLQWEALMSDGTATECRQGAELPLPSLAEFSILSYLLPHKLCQVALHNCPQSMTLERARSVCCHFGND